ncbi:MAG: aspartate/tyrosine/aromatic aminotransferase [Alphaproteobacteria bacterium]|nr:aspartate/tyrosine/aromatic aminotransferase [Alphaproteobacteria bacterium]MBV9370168.1 aspartate/tyrosine/aromatic aminotransferase [Alphaproteobacteria bacterium]MBV9901071.1 aspartate/tyrosine/aromatic aminotransferase [Alphaproteobacteria bacterium]
MAGDVITAEPPQLFDRLEEQKSDSLLQLIALCDADPRPDKIDVGVGVYRDAAGATPILRAVKAAEKRLWETQETKAYLGSMGDARFTALIRPIVFGDTLAKDDRIVGLQTPGGCGALRLGADLVARANPRARIHVGQPTWPNHGPLIECSGVEMVSYPYYDAAQRIILFDRMMDALGRAEAGDLLLLHGCCHNPTGADLSLDQWREVAALVSRRGLIPYVDLAYQGLGNGLEADAAGTRLVVEAAEQALIAQSCDKNFGVYRERTGNLFVKAGSKRAAEVVFGNLLTLARTMWSMPPDHGAAIARIVLDTPELRADWNAELKEMCARIRTLRARLAGYDERLAYIDGQNGMFSILPLREEQVLALRREKGIYLANSGRFNVVGLSDDNVDRFAAAVVEKLDG